MKKIFYSLCFSLLTFSLAAQPPGGGPGGPGGPGGANPVPGGGNLYGKLVDPAGKGIGRASVLILREQPDPKTGKIKSILVKGIATSNNGEFSAEGLPVGKPLKISISAVGFAPLSQQITLTPQASEKDLGSLKLAIATKEMQEVVVTATKPTMSLDMDKKVFNVSKDIVSAGGTGLDVLKNVPSVNVDIDGNITMRGASPQIMVDGKPTTLTLDEIPSDAIESIEVITNPSAKYDASGGGAGILNIVLKKNRKQGYNGSVRANADSHGATGLGAGLNFRENKINFSADVNYRTIRDRMSGSTERTTLSSSPETYIGEQELDTTKGYLIFERIGLDYFVSNRTTLSLTGFGMQHSARATSAISMDADSLYPSGTVYQYGQEHIDAPHSFMGHGGTVGMKHLFAKDKEEWTADVSYFSGNATNSSLYVTNEYGDKAESVLLSNQLQKIVGSGNDQNIILQTDYTDPVTSKMTVETGLRAAIQDRLNINNNYTYDPDSAGYLLIPSAASNYKSTSEVYAAYATLSSSIGKFTYKVGLRAESSKYHGTLLNTGQSFGNQYPISLFPSLFFSQKLGDDQELQLSYTRRVNRPNFFQLVPYTDSSNKLNITRGNPDLVPEFTQSVELTYLKNFPGRNTLMGSVYYKYTNHLITNYIIADTDYSTGATTLINTFINANSSRSVGAELTTQNTLAKWWDLSANVNVYHSEINASNESGISQLALWSWFGKASTNFRLPSGFALQVSGMYQSKTNLPVNNNSNQPGPPSIMSQNASQGYIRPFYEVDLGLKKTLLNNKITFMLSLNDIFKSRIQDQYSYSEYFVQDNRRIRNPQLVRFNFTYNFGKVDASLFHRKNNNMASEGE
jgi:ferric enterobactin receptor